MRATSSAPGHQPVWSSVYATRRGESPRWRTWRCSRRMPPCLVLHLREPTSVLPAVGRGGAPPAGHRLGEVRMAAPGRRCSSPAPEQEPAARLSTRPAWRRSYVGSRSGTHVQASAVQAVGPAQRGTRSGSRRLRPAYTGTLGRDYCATDRSKTQKTSSGPRCGARTSPYIPGSTTGLVSLRAGLPGRDHGLGQPTGAASWRPCRTRWTAAGRSPPAGASRRCAGGAGQTLKDASPLHLQLPTRATVAVLRPTSAAFTDRVSGRCGAPALRCVLDGPRILKAGPWCLDSSWMLHRAASGKVAEV